MMTWDSGKNRAAAASSLGEQLWIMVTAVVSLFILGGLANVF